MILDTCHPLLQRALVRGLVVQYCQTAILVAVNAIQPPDQADLRVCQLQRDFSFLFTVDKAPAVGLALVCPIKISLPMFFPAHRIAERGGLMFEHGIEDFVRYLFKQRGTLVRWCVLLADGLVLTLQYLMQPLTVVTLLWLLG